MNSAILGRGVVLASNHNGVGARKVRASLDLPADLLEEARDAAVFLAGYPVRLMLTRLTEDTFRNELRRLKDR